jgi:hypothetical protein
VRGWVLGIEGGPLVSLAVATNVLSALTGSASGGLTIALDALGPTYMQLAKQHGIEPALLHRVAVIGAGTLDSLPHNGAVVTLLAVCGSTHAKSYFDIVMVGIVGACSGRSSRIRSRQRLIRGVADDRAGHAMAAAAAAAELGADDGDDLDALLAQQRVGVGVAVVGEDHARRGADQVGA